MTKREIERKLEKVQTLLEDLREEWPESASLSQLTNALGSVERAEESVGDALDLMTQVDDDEDDEGDDE